MAGVILMDQFTRNIYRGTPQAFSLDTKAMTWVNHIIDSGASNELPVIMRAFLYTPFMHCEDVPNQKVMID